MYNDIKPIDKQDEGWHPKSLPQSPKQTRKKNAIALTYLSTPIKNFTPPEKHLPFPLPQYLVWLQAWVMSQTSFVPC